MIELMAILFLLGASFGLGMISILLFATWRGWLDVVWQRMRGESDER